MNRNYEAEKAKYVDTLIFRVMELEAKNEILHEKLSGQGNNNYINSKEYQNLRKKLMEANEKYRKVTMQYAALKESINTSNDLHGLRKFAKKYADYGLVGICKKLMKK